MAIPQSNHWFVIIALRQAIYRSGNDTRVQSAARKCGRTVDHFFGKTNPNATLTTQLKGVDMSIIKKTFLVFVTCYLAACSSTKLEEKTDNVIPLTVGSQSAKYDPISDPKSPLYQKGSIYFDFDEYTVKGSYQPLLKAHADYLISSQSRMVIEGNTDDRGTSEYNLALGQRRSEAVKKALIALGVNGNQIEAVSFGEEKPKNTGTGEKAWQENRRADIVYR